MLKTPLPSDAAVQGAAGASRGGSKKNKTQSGGDERDPI